MRNLINISQSPSPSDRITNDVWLDDKEQLVTSSIIQSKSKQSKQLSEGLKMDQKLFSDDLEKMGSMKSSKPKFFNCRKAVICFLLMILILLFSMAFFQKDLLRYIMSRLAQPKIQIHEQTQPPRAQIKRPKCKEDLHIFRVYYNPIDKQMKKMREFISQNDECNFPIFGFWDLEEINEKWNFRYPNNQIDLNNIAEDWQKEQLLVLYKLYFEGGIYINLSIPFWKISNRALKYALTGLDPIYADFSEKTEKGIYVPDSKKFMKVRAPYSPVIRDMIMKIAKNEDFLDNCRQKQCLIIR